MLTLAGLVGLIPAFFALVGSVGRSPAELVGKSIYNSSLAVEFKEHYRRIGLQVVDNRSYCDIMRHAATYSCALRGAWRRACRFESANGPLQAAPSARLG
jgi:hypothetical protein